MRMNSPATARNGNLVSAAGMVAAIAGLPLLAVPSEEGDEGFNTIGWVIIQAGIALGGGLGLYTARTVKMTAMPQLVLFNAAGGGAAALIAIDDYLGLTSVPAAQIGVATVLDIVIGSITFTGSLIASGKLMGLSITPSRPVIIPGGGRMHRRCAGADRVVGAVWPWAGNLSVPVMFLILAASLVFGVTRTLPIGGADMPVVISLLNSFTGTAVAMAGFEQRRPDHRRRPRRRIRRDPPSSWPTR